MNPYKILSIVTRHTPEKTEIIGVFDTQQLAEQAIADDLKLMSLTETQKVSNHYTTTLTILNLNRKTLEHSMAQHNDRR